MARTIDDLTGQKFGRLTCLEYLGIGPGGARWRLACECGGEATKYTGELRRQRRSAKSCGCSMHDPRPSITTHGHSRGGKPTRTYYAWTSAKNRCHNPKHHAFHNYGGRGIQVCDRWRYSFENFLADLGVCPKDLSLERIDNSLGYEPGNCKWATLEEQGANRRYVIQADGVPLRVYAQRAGVRYTSFLKWFHAGMTAEQAVAQVKKVATKPLPTPI